MKKFLLCAIALGLLASCAQTSNGVVSGLYTSWKDRDPMTRVDNSVAATKTGTACVTSILGLVVTGDSSVETAKKVGGISRVSYVDRTYDGVMLWFPVYTKGCTVVKGN
jgi:hypothetical protein